MSAGGGGSVVFKEGEGEFEEGVAGVDGGNFAFAGVEAGHGNGI